jgi:hypothetical protein
VDRHTIQQLATIGQIFRWLAAVSWRSTELVFESQRLLRNPVACMRVYHAALAEGMQAAGLSQ